MLQFMKTIASIALIILFTMSCKSTQSLDPQTGIVGKWSPTYITQTRLANGTFEPWQRINTLVALPVYEFTSDGKFLKDGRSGASCCYSGSNYSISDSNILFTGLLVCPGVKCPSCAGWKIQEIKGDTLILEECSARNKYVRIK